MSNGFLPTVGNRQQSPWCSKNKTKHTHGSIYLSIPYFLPPPSPQPSGDMVHIPPLYWTCHKPFHCLTENHISIMVKTNQVYHLISTKFILQSPVQQPGVRTLFLILLTWLSAFWPTLLKLIFTCFNGHEIIKSFSTNVTDLTLFFYSLTLSLNVIYIYFHNLNPV